MTSPQPYYVYVGTYTSLIYICQFDPLKGALRSLGTAPGSMNPSYLAIHPGRGYLYAVNELPESEAAVSSYSIDPRTGLLTLLNKECTQGAAPCYVSIDGTGEYLFVANYTGGSVIMFPILGDGSIGQALTIIRHEGSSVHPHRQEGPHPHSIVTDPTNTYLLVPDLGTDRIFIYNKEAGLHRAGFAEVQPQAGPRHITFHPQGLFAYVINELDATITVFRPGTAWDELIPVQTVSTVPTGHAENTGADIHVHPSGRILYGSNRGHDSLVIYQIDQDTGKLAYVDHQTTLGKTPRNFVIDPTGRWLLVANQDSDTIIVFAIDQRTGRLRTNGQFLEVPRPVCVKMAQIS
jgi:6-phosphogluconolactonase